LHWKQPLADKADLRVKYSAIVLIQKDLCD
jgi:hypothetical protein